MKKMFFALAFASLGSVANADSLVGCFHYEYISDIVYYGEVEAKETPQGFEIKDKNGVVYVLVKETEEELCFVKK